MASTFLIPIPISIVSISGTARSVPSGIAGSMDAIGILSSCSSGIMSSKLLGSIAAGVTRLGSSELDVMPSAGAYKVVTPGCAGTSYSSSELSLDGVDGGFGVAMSISIGYGDSTIPARTSSMEMWGSGMTSPGLVGDIKVPSGCVITMNSAGSTSNFGCQTLWGSVPVTLILGAGRSSKSRRLGLKIRFAGPGLLWIGAGFLRVVKEVVAPETVGGDPAMVF